MRKVRCPRCGLLNHGGISHCQNCGLPRSSSSSSTSRIATTTGASTTTLRPAHISTTTHTVGSTTGSTLANLFGWTVLRGVIIQVDKPYMIRPKFNWVGFLIKGALLIFLLPIILGVGLAFFVVSLFLTIVGFRRMSGGSPSLVSHFFYFLLSHKLLGSKSEVAVRDLRLRDVGGNEHLVRIKGDFLTGNVNVGDDVTVEGFNRGGTLIFWRGQNHR